MATIELDNEISTWPSRRGEPQLELTSREDETVLTVTAVTETAFDISFSRDAKSNGLIGRYTTEQLSALRDWADQQLRSQV